jgi:subtilisin family serine protease
MKKILVLAALAAAFLSTNVFFSFPTVSAKANKFHSKTDGIPGRYIVLLNEEQLGSDMAQPTVDSNAQYLAAVYGGNVHQTYFSAVKGFVANMSAEQALAMSMDENVTLVEQDSLISVSASQLNPGWHLDRVDQRNLPWSSTYSYDQNGAGVHAYILDTGIRSTHVDFGGRANAVYDNVGDGQNGNDCNGHGTHVAGILGGSTYGVAKGSSLHAIRVMNCSGVGSIAGLLDGIDWLTAHHASPAVANISLAAGGFSPSLELGVTNSINSGVTYAVAAGNANADACNFTPSRTTAAITVGASDETDLRALYSNWGTCVDIFAPGNQVISAGIANDTAARSLSGSSMAAPMVAGAAALYLQTHPTASPSAVASAIIGTATSGVLDTLNTPSPNKLLYSWVNGAPAPTPTVTPTPTPTPTSTPTNAKVTVKKRVRNVTTVETPTTAFPYSAVNLSTSNFALQTNQDYIDPNVQPSTSSNPIIVTEAPVDGWMLDSISCMDAAGGTANTTVDLVNHKVTIIAGQGQQIECTFTSEQLAPTAADAVISGRVADAYGRGVRNISLFLFDPQTGVTRSVRTNAFGYYTFVEVEVGHTYMIEAAETKRWSIANSQRTVTPTDNIIGLDFQAEEN